MKPSLLSNYLRNGSDPDLRRRRAIIALSLLGTAAGQVVGAFQTGLLRGLPDPPGPFDSARVDASEYAYKRAQTPDGLPMIASYAVTATLASTGGPDRPRTMPLVPLALAGKAVGDLLVALELAREEWQENRAFCAYCQLATLASAATAVLAFPEARRALGAALRGR